MDKDRAKVEFFGMATQYYVSGRFATHSQFMPVAGNLLHHAIEMYLKGALSEWSPLEELREVKHNLPQIWKAFKDKLHDPRLDAFDSTIDELHRFEKIRYPDWLLSEGAELTISVRSGMRVGSEGGSLPPPPPYNLVLEDVDELVKTIFEKAHVNPPFFTQRLGEHGRRYLDLDNLHPL